MLSSREALHEHSVEASAPRRRRVNFQILSLALRGPYSVFARGTNVRSTHCGHAAATFPRRLCFRCFFKKTRSALHVLSRFCRPDQGSRRLRALVFNSGSTSTFYNVLFNFARSLAATCSQPTISRPRCSGRRSVYPPTGREQWRNRLFFRPMRERPLCLARYCSLVRDKIVGVELLARRCVRSVVRCSFLRISPTNMNTHAARSFSHPD